MPVTLHCFGESGNAYKCALALELTGTPWTPAFVDFFHGATRTPAFRALNPMGEVPVLQDGDLVLSQSGAILLHIARATGRLGDPEDPEILRWILWDNHKLSGQAGALRFLMNFAPPDRRDPAVIAFLQGRLKSAYAVLDGTLAGRAWLAGRDVTVADLSCCGYLFYPEPFGFARADLPHVDRWLARIEGLPGWRHPYDLMPGNPKDRAR